MTLKLQTAATISAAAVLAVASIGGTALLQSSTNPTTPAPQTAAAAPTTQPGALVGRLSDGTTVTLFAVGNQNLKWWTPDGTAEVTETLGIPMIESSPKTEVGEGEIGIAVALGVQGNRKGIDFATFRVPSTNTGLSKFSNGVHLSFTTDNDEEPTYAEVLVPVGDPRIIRMPVELLSQHPAIGEEVRITFAPLEAGKGPTAQPGGWLNTMLQIEGDLAGTTLSARLIMNDGTSIPGYVAAAPDGMPHVRPLSFHGGNPAQAREIVVTIAPQEMVRFTGLAKRPGAGAQPQVEVLDHEATTELLRSKRAQLDQSMGAALSFSAAPLADVVKYLSLINDWKVECDWDALEPLGVSRTTEIKLTIPADVPFIKVVELVAAQAGLDLEIGDSAIRLIPRSE